jgi:pescadillo protein
VKVHERRVSKARAKSNFKLARRLLAAKPGYKLDHLVKER